MQTIHDTSNRAEVAWIPTYLFGLNSAGVLLAEAELSNGHIIEDDVEVLSTLNEVSSDHEWYLLPHRDELSSIELGNDRLEHLVDDGRQHLQRSKQQLPSLTQQTTATFSNITNNSYLH